MKSWEKSYVTRIWKTYKISLGSSDIPPLCPVEETELVACGGDSEVAAELKESSKRFYYDWEQIAAGMDTVYGLDQLARLTASWKGHPRGTLIMVLYAGVREEPPCLTYAVEIQTATTQ